MTIVSMNFRKGEQPPPLNDEQKAMLARLKDLSDDEIELDNWEIVENKADICLDKEKFVIKKLGVLR